MHTVEGSNVNIPLNFTSTKHFYTASYIATLKKRNGALWQLLGTRSERPDWKVYVDMLHKYGRYD